MTVSFKQNYLIAVIRWTARFLTIFNIIIIGMFLQGFDYQKVRFEEWFGLLLFPFGVVFGALLAWWNELLGSLISLASLAVFYLVYGYFVNGSIIQSWTFMFFAVPAILFLISRYFPKQNNTVQARILKF